jgi:hypothetical protein
MAPQLWIGRYRPTCLSQNVSGPSRQCDANPRDHPIQVLPHGAVRKSKQPERVRPEDRVALGIDLGRVLRAVYLHDQSGGVAIEIGNEFKMWCGRFLLERELSSNLSSNFLVRALASKTMSL